MVDESAIRDKLVYLKINMNRIKTLQKNNSEKDFINDWTIYTSCERLFEVIVQILIDVCTHIISFYPSKPESGGECLQYLITEKIIKESLGKGLMSAIKMRNLLVHQYAKVNYSILFNSIENLVTDGKEFSKQIKYWLENRENNQTT